MWCYLWLDCLESQGEVAPRWLHTNCNDVCQLRSPGSGVGLLSVTRHKLLLTITPWRKQGEWEEYPPNAHQASLALGAHGETGKGNVIWPWSFYPTQVWQMDLWLCVIWNLITFDVCKEFSYSPCYFPWAGHASVIEWQPLPGSLANLKSVRDSGAKGHQKKKK